jgi:hypothetical protein
VIVYAGYISDEKRRESKDTFLFTLTLEDARLVGVKASPGSSGGGIKNFQWIICKEE